MTSRSLRNLQTTLWSMLPKTDLVTAGRGLSRRLRGAGLTALAMAVLASYAGADEASGRARLESESPLPPAKAATHRESGKSKVAQTKKSAIYWQSSSVPKSPVPAVPASRSRVLSGDEPVTEPLPVRREPAQERTVSASSALKSPATQPAAKTKPQLAGDPHEVAGPMVDWESDYSARMDSVVAGKSVDATQGSVGEWWSARTQGLLDSCRQVGHSSEGTQAGGLRQAARNFLARHTLPDEVDFDQDVYDSRPVAVSAPAIRHAGAQETSNDPAGVAAHSRLKTDIRSIQPTLGYALKNIKSNQLPDDFDTKLDNGEYVARATSPTVLQWAPTNFYHYPLYFEDPSLERYGHTYHPLIQPFASTGRFATQLVGLPYQMTLHPIASREYALGYYRPGECAPKKHYQIPFNEEATLMQVAIIAGLIIVIP